MRRSHVDSSNLQSVGYDPINQILEVEFRSGDIYVYYGVPEVVYRELMAAQSHGRFFSAQIRLNYRYEKVR